ncbi:MAG: MerR family transcriptional regulator [Pseudomonadota bacterium]
MQARKRPEDTDELPAIPGKRYFTIGEASELCAVKPHVLRYWEQEFPKLSPVKRRGNRRYYQREDIELIRRIRALLYDQGFTISGARQQLDGADSEGHGSPGSLRDMILRVESVLALLREGLQRED